MTTPYIDPNLIFAENAPTQDKPAAFKSYDRGWDAARNNDGRPTIKQSNFLQQQNDLKNRYIHENGAALPYKEGVAYEENAVVVKDGVLQQWKSGSWVLVGDDKLSKASNLSDIQDAAAARTNLGLGTAATATLTTSQLDSNRGRVLRVGDFGIGAVPSGWGSYPTMTDVATSTENNKHLPTGFYVGIGYYALQIKFAAAGAFARLVLPSGYSNKVPQPTFVIQTESSGVLTYTLWNSRNTTVDGNGFIKRASPIVQLFADKIELNDEAQQQEITFEKLSVGDYMIKGSTGFAQDGWYIETPKDANGNILVAVVYEQLENGDISIKTYDYMLNNKGRIVADTETPLDIPETRWIDLRLQELPSNLD